MGMFSKNGFYAESAVAFNDADIIAQECFEDNMHVAALRVVAESENNWNQIMKAMAITELAAYEETGDADYYVTESGSGFLQSVKDFFKKLLEKIKGIFQKFIATVDSWTKDDKAFVSKYKDKVMKANTTDFEFEGYNFTYKEFSFDDRATAKADYSKNFVSGFESKTDSEWEDLTKNCRGDKLEEILDAYRGTVIREISSSNFSGNSDSSDFSKDLFEALRDGESSKTTIDKVTPIEYLNAIQNTGDVKKKAKKAYDSLQKGINDAIKDVDKAEKEVTKQLLGKDADDVRKQKAAYVAFCGAYSGLLRSQESINTQAYGAWLQAVKDKNRQAKAVCVKLMSRKVKNESTSYYEEGGSLLGNIRMI